MDSHYTDEQLPKTIKKTNKYKKYFINKSKKYSKCAPYIDNTGNIKKGKTKKKMKVYKSAFKNTCFSRNALIRLIDLWNKYYKSRDEIKYSKSTSNVNLWKKIQNVMKNKCKNEICWIKQDFAKKERKYLEENFRPLMPPMWYNKKSEWLNTLDIEAALQQYEVKYPNFKIIGAVPIDFDSKLSYGECVVNELCNINLSKLHKKDKIDYIGVVFNLDKHNQDGSHWIAMYCDLIKSNICYWDSYGLKPPKQVNILMKRLQKQGKELNKNLIIKINKKRHQYNGSECGIYCINFIVSLLEGKSFEKVTNTIIPDKKINYLRSKFFLPL